MTGSRIELLRNSVLVPKASKERPTTGRRLQYRFLIVCEGEKTEPNYFRAIIKNPQYSTVIDAELRGLGRSTVSLVKATAKIRDEIEERNELTFDGVWVVFDEDGKKDFNKAITMARSLRLKSAWTNEAFELWYYLHFEYLNTGIDRHTYIDKINAVLRKRMKDKSFSYKKNDKGFYALLQKYGDEAFAKKCASNLRKLYDGTDYNQHKPCTMVDLLVNELEHPEEYYND